MTSDFDVRCVSPRCSAALRVGLPPPPARSAYAPEEMARRMADSHGWAAAPRCGLFASSDVDGWPALLSALRRATQGQGAVLPRALVVQVPPSAWLLGEALDLAALELYAPPLVALFVSRGWRIVDRELPPEVRGGRACSVAHLADAVSFFTKEPTT